MPTWVKYILFQVPGWILAVIVILALRVWLEMSLIVAVVIFCLWVIKDLLFYPLLRVAYQTGPKTVVEELVGLKCIARENLDPNGYVYVRGELWRAETETTAIHITTGSTVRILRVRGMTLIVTAEKSRGK